MKRKLVVPVLLMVMLGCSKNPGTIPTDIGPKIAGFYWRVFEYTRNGTSDPNVIVQQHTFEFRFDYKMYYSQINPLSRDTFEFAIADNENIRLTKPWISNTYYENVKVDSISATDFHFTLTSTLNADVKKYKTRKQ